MANHGFEAFIIFFHLQFTVGDKPFHNYYIQIFPQLLHTNISTITTYKYFHNYYIQITESLDQTEAAFFYYLPFQLELEMCSVGLYLFRNKEVTLLPLQGQYLYLLELHI